MYIVYIYIYIHIVVYLCISILFVLLLNTWGVPSVFPDVRRSLSYAEVARLAETRLAQNSLDYLKIACATLKSTRIP